MYNDFRWSAIELHCPANRAPLKLRPYGATEIRLLLLTGRSDRTVLRITSAFIYL